MQGRHSSPWLDGTDSGSFPPLPGDLTTDVAVVGAGITGLTTALLLQRAGLRVVVLERDHVGAGTSGQTTAHLSTLTDARYSILEEDFGDKTAHRVADAMRDGIDRVQLFVEELGIDCQFERLPGWLYAEIEDERILVDRELQAARRAGLDIAPHDPSLPFHTAGGIKVERQACFHPLLYLRALAEALVAGGGAVHTGTRVLDFHDGSPCRVETGRGEVRCRDLVLATHTPLGINLLQTVLLPQRSYALVAGLRRELPHGLYWDTAEPYHYVRPVHGMGDRQGSGDRPGSEDRLYLIGGADHETGEDSAPAAYAALETYARDRFEVEEIVHRWSSQFYDPADGLPMIGRGPLQNHVCVGTGYSGDGMVWGTVAGMLLADRIAERDNPYADLFRPARLNLTMVEGFVEENLSVAKHLALHRLATGDRSRVESLAPGEGVVVGGPAQPTAASRDEAGRLHLVSANCSHLGCVIHWNAGEKSWDCPCHGSRFTPDGRVIQGPALQDLSAGAESAGGPTSSARSPAAAARGTGRR